MTCPSRYHVTLGVGEPAKAVTNLAGVPSSTVRSANGVNVGDASFSSIHNIISEKIF
jgi:hypothetical protein